MTNDETLIEELKAHEGWRRKPYLDSRGIETIGCGRNLRDVGLRDDEITLMLRNDVRAAQADLDAHLPWWRGLTPGRQRVLSNMAFNMGIVVLLKFSHFLAAAKAGDYPTAAIEMLNSHWADQVGERAHYLANIMRVGDFQPQA